MRYAVYFYPAPGSGLEAFGREWLATASMPGLPPARLQALKVNVLRYGWHATISAPCELAEGVGYSDFRQTVADIANHAAPIELPLQLDRLGSFLALRSASNESAVKELAERCVRRLNPLRAPLTDAAWQRRAAVLDDVEIALFREFGYPYVLERYRFHMTLSAPAEEAEEQALRAWLAPRVAQLSAAYIDALTICRESEPGQPFEPIERIPLGQERAG